MIRDSDARMSSSVAGVVRQVVAEVSAQRPTSAFPCRSVPPIGSPAATYSVLYSLISSGQLVAL